MKDLRQLAMLIDSNIGWIIAAGAVVIILLSADGAFSR